MIARDSNLDREFRVECLFPVMKCHLTPRSLCEFAVQQRAGFPQTVVMILPATHWTRKFEVDTNTLFCCNLARENVADTHPCTQSPLQVNCLFLVPLPIGSNPPRRRARRLS
jgi:hypothetical protein